MISKFKCMILSFTCFLLLSMLIACGTTTNSDNSKNNYAQNRNTNTNSTPNANSTPSNNEDAKAFTEFVVAAIYKPPPTPDVGESDSSLRVGEIKEKLTVSSLDEIALVLTPEKYQVAVESLQLEIYSGDKKLYTVPTISTRQSREFPPIEKTGTNATGYVFNLDPQRIAEANRYFVNENNVRVVLTAKLGNTGVVTVYLVDKNSEVGKEKQAR
jgi:hypothetical protein